MTLHDYLSSLSTGRPKNEQNAAVFTLANELGRPRRLVMPPEGISCWRNAALTLRLMGRPMLDDALPAMMSWLRDMSWPGAEEIRRLLLETVPKGNLCGLIEAAAQKALEQGDGQWLCNLGRLLAPAGLEEQDFRNPEVHRALVSAASRPQ